jgi:3-oxoacyl-[acyl-carrier-protein] synthase II
VLESREHAESRGATILATVRGSGRGFEFVDRPLESRGAGIRHSIEVALQSAGLEPSQIGHVNAHAAGMVQDDQIEAQAIRDCLGDAPVTAPKSYFGCLGAGTGAVEMACSVLALAEGRVPPTLNYEQPDPACPVNVIHGDPLPIENRNALLLNQAETGQTAAVILAAP